MFRGHLLLLFRSDSPAHLKRNTRYAWHDLSIIASSTPLSCKLSTRFILLYNADHICKCSTPETFDIVSQTVDIPVRKNLSQISRVLTQITRGEEFGDDSPCYVPINDFVRNAMKQFSNWFVQGVYYRWSSTCVCHLTVI